MGSKDGRSQRRRAGGYRMKISEQFEYFLEVNKERQQQEIEDVKDKKELIKELNSYAQKYLPEGYSIRIDPSQVNYAASNWFQFFWNPPHQHINDPLRGLSIPEFRNANFMPVSTQERQHCGLDPGRIGPYQKLGRAPQPEDFSHFRPRATPSRKYLPLHGGK